jgi:hypothetical protein
LCCEVAANGSFIQVLGTGMAEGALRLGKETASQGPDYGSQLQPSMVQKS